MSFILYSDWYQMGDWCLIETLTVSDQVLIQDRSCFKTWMEIGINLNRKTFDTMVTRLFVSF